MKIGIVCYPTYGGSGVVATELGIALAGLGHQVHFITYRRPARLVGFHENVFFHEVGDINYPLFEYVPYDTALTSKLVDVIDHEKLDLLHVHYAIPHAAVAYLAKKILLTSGRYIPVITTLHGTDITLVGSDPSFAPVVQFGMNKSDGITAVSQFLKAKTEELFDVEKEIEVIYNFIDLERFQRRAKSHFRHAIAPADEKILIHTSNFRKVKRVQDVVDVFGRVRQVFPAKLLMIGDGPERAQTEEMCRRLGLCSDIRFLGKQDIVDELLSVADVFLLPSANESFGLAALEAMACGVPVVSSNAGGIPELNVHGETGFISEVGDTAAMADQVMTLLGDAQVLDRFRTGARRQAERFDLRTIVPRYERYYLEVIEKAKVGAIN